MIKRITMTRLEKRNSKRMEEKKLKKVKVTNCSLIGLKQSVTTYCVCFLNLLHYCAAPFKA